MADEKLYGPRQVKNLYPRDPNWAKAVDALWRVYYGLYNEKYKKYVETDELGELIDPWLKNKISKDISYGQGIGQDHLIAGNRSFAFGQGGVTKSFMEIVLGAYNIIPEGQNAEEWIPTDLLLTLGNGKDKDHRSNVFEIYKNGLFKLIYALVLGAYPALPEGQTPKPGSLQYTTEKGFEKWNDNKKEWEPLIGNTTNIINNTFVENTIIVNNNTTIIYLGQNPAVSSVRVYLNGIRQHYSTYTVSENTVTLNEAPWPGDDVLIYYEAWKADISITEIPSGDIDGENVDFVCSEIPEPTSLNAYLNGVLLHPRKYTITGVTIHFLEAPFTGDTVLVDYLISSDSGRAYNETPSGAINGVNVDFTLARAPTDEKAKVYLNGVRQIQTMHYSITGAIITFLAAPFTNDQIICDYEY